MFTFSLYQSHERQKIPCLSGLVNSNDCRCGPLKLLCKPSNDMEYIDEKLFKNRIYGEGKTMFSKCGLLLFMCFKKHYTRLIAGFNKKINFCIEINNKLILKYMQLIKHLKSISWPHRNILCTECPNDYFYTLNHLINS